MSWKDDECRPRRRVRGRAKPLTDDVETRVGGIFFTNNEHTHVLLYNTDTKQVIQLPDDGVVLVVIDQQAAYDLRDDLLDPTEFPEDIHQ